MAAARLGATFLFVSVLTFGAMMLFGAALKFCAASLIGAALLVGAGLSLQMKAREQFTLRSAISHPN
eukprot:1150565-Pelagomonas_calceolata.AAC.11